MYVMLAPRTLISGSLLTWACMYRRWAPVILCHGSLSTRPCVLKLSYISSFDHYWQIKSEPLILKEKDLHNKHVGLKEGISEVSLGLNEMHMG